MTDLRAAYFDQDYPMTDIHPDPLPRAATVGHQLAFYPVLVTQGLWVKWTTPHLPDPKGPREGVAGEGPDLRVLIAGDSSALGVGVTTQSQALSGQLVGMLSKTARVDWQLIAHSGETTPQALARLRAAQPRRADVVVTGLGVNDILRGTRLSVWLDQQRALWEYLLGTLDVGHVYVSGLPPLGQFPRLPRPLNWALGHQAARFDRALCEVARAHLHVTHIPATMKIDASVMSADGFHPGPDVYSAWAQAAVKAMAAHREV